MAGARAGQGAAGSGTDARVAGEGVEFRGRQGPPGPERAVRTDRLERPHGDLLPLVAEEGHHRVGAVRLPGRDDGVRDLRLLVRRHRPGRVPGSPELARALQAAATSGCRWRPRDAVRRREGHATTPSGSRRCTTTALRLEVRAAGRRSRPASRNGRSGEGGDGRRVQTGDLLRVARRRDRGRGRRRGPRRVVLVRCSWAG